MNRKAKRSIAGIVAFLLIAGIIIAVILFLTTNRQPPIGTEIGLTAPDFTLENLDGVAISLSGFRGRVVLLEFWQSTCPACRRAMPHQKELYERYKDKGLVWVGVTLDHDPDVARAYLEETGFLDQITLWQSFDDAMDIVDLFAVELVPRVFVIDRRGIIRYAGTYPDQPQTSDIEPWL